MAIGYNGSGWSYAQPSPPKRRPRPRPTPPTDRFTPPAPTRKPTPRPMPPQNRFKAPAKPASNITYRAPSAAPASAGQAAITQRVPEPRTPSPAPAAAGMAAITQRIPQAEEPVTRRTPVNNGGGGNGGGGGGGGGDNGREPYGGNGAGGQGANGTQLREDTAEMERIQALRNRWKAVLAALAAGSYADEGRFRAGSEAASNMIRRGAFNDVRSHRRNLSAAGLGFSPRFMNLATRAIAEKRDADLMSERNKYQANVQNLLRDLQMKRAEAREALSEAELARLLDGTQRGLRDLNVKPFFATK